jgi:polyvinyl alcohol dehydrogenase (cytochrome)
LYTPVSSREEPAGVATAYPCCTFRQTAALTLIPGVVLSGEWDGMLRALSSTDGRPLWDFNMKRDFTTVNGVRANGGAMGASGPTVAGGMLFVGSGYVFGGISAPGNVLLAFSAQ